MATLSELRKNPQAQRKFFIFGAVLLAALGWLVLPSWLPHHASMRADERTPAKHKAGRDDKNTAPIADGKSPTTGDPAPASVPAPVTAPDPYGKLLGKWGGQAQVPGRNVCSLQLELHENKDGQTFTGFTTLSCVPSMMDVLAAQKQTGNKAPAGAIAAMMKGMAPVSTSYTGAVVEGAIMLRATDNIGVKENPSACALVSMTLREFGEGRLSVKWQEQESGNCHGGEMILAMQG